VENGNLAEHTDLTMSFDETGTVPMIRVVEDDPYTLMICLRLLQKNGFACEGFSAAEDLLKTPWRSGPAIILTDIHLPGISGIELCSLLKEKAVPDLQIIALDTSLERRALLDAGFDEVLTKPFTEQSLMAILGGSLKTELAFPLLDQLIEDPEERANILQQFRKDTQTDLTLLEDAIEGNKQDTAALLVHRLAGRFAQMDQRELASALHELETDLRGDKQLTELSAKLHAVIAVIRKFQGKLDLVL
jgi:CheY-like chemotaxis protein